MTISLIYEIIAVTLAIAGLFAISYQKRWGWLIWIVSDCMWAGFFIYNGFAVRGVLEVFYTGQCVWAYWKWGQFKHGTVFRSKRQNDNESC